MREEDRGEVLRMEMSLIAILRGLEKKKSRKRKVLEFIRRNFANLRNKLLGYIPAKELHMII